MIDTVVTYLLYFFAVFFLYSLSRWTLNNSEMVDLDFNWSSNGCDVQLTENWAWLCDSCIMQWEISNPEHTFFPVAIAFFVFFSFCAQLDSDRGVRYTWTVCSEPPFSVNFTRSPISIFRYLADYTREDVSWLLWFRRHLVFDANLIDYLWLYGT